MSEPLRILLLTGEFPPMRGSVGDHTARLATTLAARGHRVGVVTSSRAAGATLAGVRLYPRIDGWNAGAWPGIARIAQNYDVIHLEYQAGAFGMGVAPQLMADGLRLLSGGKPLLTTFHDLLVPYLFPKAGRLRAWSVRHLARASDGTIATNPEDAATLRGWGGGPVWEIPIAAPLPVAEVVAEPWDREAWRRGWQVGEEHRLIVHYGFLNRAKGVEYLFEAYDALLRAGQPYRLLMAGEPLGDSDPSNQGYLEELQKRAVELNLEPPWLQWTGDLSERELVRAVQAADLVVLPYREGASLRRSTLVMALTLGRPVVTTQPPHPIPLLANKENIIYARREDGADLAREIALLLRYEPTRQRIERGAAEVGRLFDWNHIADRTVAAYRVLLGQAETPAAAELS